MKEVGRQMYTVRAVGNLNQSLTIQGVYSRNSNEAILCAKQMMVGTWHNWSAIRDDAKGHY